MLVLFVCLFVCFHRRHRNFGQILTLCKVFLSTLGNCSVALNKCVSYASAHFWRAGRTASSSSGLGAARQGEGKGNSSCNWEVRTKETNNSKEKPNLNVRVSLGA